MSGGSARFDPSRESEANHQFSEFSGSLISLKEEDQMDLSLVSFASYGRTKWPIFTHFHILRRMWEYTILIVSMTCIFEISFIAIFVPKITLAQYSPFLLVDLLYLIDLYVVTHTAYISHGVLIESPTRIRKRYGKFALICHIIGCVPLGWLGCFTSVWWGHVLLSLNRLFRLRRTIEAVSVINSSLIYSSWIARLFPLISLLFCLIHFFACLFYLSAFLESDHLGTWIYVLRWNNLSPPQQYVVACYFTMTTIMTIGYGDLTPQTSSERIVVTFIQLTGVLINAFLVGTLVSLLMDPIGNDFIQDFRGMWSYMKFKKIPNELRSQILNIYQEKFQRYKGSPDPTTVFKFIPQTVANHLKIDTTIKCLKEIPGMDIASDRLLFTIANIMKPISFCPGDVVFKQGDVIPILFLFQSGIVDFYINDELFNTMNCDHGVGIGDIEMLIDRPRHATVKAVTFLEGWTVSRNALLMSVSHQLDLKNELLANFQMVFVDYSDQINELFAHNDGLTLESLCVPAKSEEFPC